MEKNVSIENYKPDFAVEAAAEEAASEPQAATESIMAPAISNASSFFII